MTRVSNFLTWFQNCRCIFNWNICIHVYEQTHFLYADFAYMCYYNTRIKKRTKERAGSFHKETNLSCVATLLYMNIFRVIQHFLHSSAYSLADLRKSHPPICILGKKKKKTTSNPQDSFFVYFEQVTRHRNRNFSLRFSRRLIT